MFASLLFRILHTNNYILYVPLILYLNDLLRLLLLNINFSSKMLFLFQVFIRNTSTSNKQTKRNQ